MYRVPQEQRAGPHLVPYSQLVWLNFYASYGIILHFGSHTVFVLGGKLTDVYERLRDRTLVSVGAEDAVDGANTPGVESVHIKQVGGNAPGFSRPDRSTLAKEDA